MKFYFVIQVTFPTLLVASFKQWGRNNQIDLILDMSTTCIDNLKSEIFLPYGMGTADASVIIISSNNLYSNCMLTYFINEDEMICLIIVVEFSGHTKGPNNACQDTNNKIFIKDPDNLTEINICDEVNKLKFGYHDTPVYSLISYSRNVSIGITSKSLFQTVKITVTSAKRLKPHESCNEKTEIACLIENVSLCISKEFLCDTNINCGTVNLNDEDVRICDDSRYKKLWLIVVCGTVMITIIAFFFIHILCICLPTVPDSFFIFNEDEDNKLILTTKFTRPAQVQSSSFTFKSIPVTQSEHLMSCLDNQNNTIVKRTSFADQEAEISSHPYENEPQKEDERVVHTMFVKNYKILFKSKLESAAVTNATTAHGSG